ncbi:hypothetical protein MMC14_005853 [Varicellaria rhodocarpa]|nr:hypothetical protein [Varicellaria rhodocarpa]
MDLTWEMSIPAEWSSAEACIGILSACLPTMRPLVPFVSDRLLPGFRSRRSHIIKSPPPLPFGSTVSAKRTSKMEQSNHHGNFQQLRDSATITGGIRVKREVLLYEEVA